MKADILTTKEIEGYVGDPCLVISALATELYIKCLLVLFDVPLKEITQFHNLYALNSKLPQQVQDRIEQLWDIDIWRQPVRDFLRLVQDEIIKQEIPRHYSTALHFGAKTFVDLRYVYEKPRDVNNIISELPSILRRVIIEIRPDWQ